MLSSLDLIEDDKHSLLEPPTPAYSGATARRAFTVWMYGGQQNEFKNVCKYYHRLEAMEETLTPDERSKSRVHELGLLSRQPPTSHFQMDHFPNLYQPYNKTKIDYKQMEEAKLDECVFNLEGYHDLKVTRWISSETLIKTSKMIKHYCRGKYYSLQHFLKEFLKFSQIADHEPTVNNLIVYIKKRFVNDEVIINKKMPTHFSFLDDDDDVGEKAVPKPEEPVQDNYEYNRHRFRKLIKSAKKAEIRSLRLEDVPESPMEGASASYKLKEKSIIFPKMCEGIEIAKDEAFGI